uniref:Uncharacterized protein n=1 Tax=Candidatus Methanosuratincola petrocarbonis (ex Vanwonterghem et al. 2016) TaxID=1867261 RepID=A0A7J3V0H9_9CREN
MVLTFQALVGGSQISKVNATLPWIVAFYEPGPPPVVADMLTSARKGAFYEEIVKLSDIRQRLDARSILVSPRRRIGVDEARLATSFGIYVVLEGDHDGLSMASSGADIGEVNSRFVETILKNRSRRVASECRSAIVELLREKWLTPEELVSELRLSFDARTVTAQLRSLARGGAVRLLARTVKGEGIYGLPGIQYPARGDLSRPSRLEYLERTVTEMLSNCDRPLTSTEMSERINVSQHQIRSIMRKLAGAQKAARTGDGWVFSGKK